MKLFKFLFKGKKKEEAPKTPTRVAVVGLDFGTSSIKIAVRELTARKKPVALLDFGTDLEGYSRFAFPSAVSVRSSTIRTGIEAVTGDPVGSLRSVKMRLLNHGAASRDWPEWLPPVEGIELPKAEFAAAMLLTSAMQKARDALEADLGTLENARVLYNLDVPVNQFDDSPSHKTFDRVLRTAYRLIDEVHFPCGRGEAIEAWIEAATGAVQDPIPEEERPVSVVGEAQAILAGISDAIDPEPHRPYVIVDIGAGTTDIGIFKLNTWAGEDRVIFYSAGTCRTGCDDLDEALCRGVWGETNAGAIQSVRIGKLKIARGEPANLSNGDRTRQIHPGALRTAVDSLRVELEGYYVGRWKEASAKSYDPNELKGAGLVVVGGGSMIRPLEQVFTRPRKAGPIVRSGRLIKISNQAPVRVIGASDHLPTDTELAFLTAARGLAHGKPNLRKLVTPNEVKHVSRERSRATGIYAVDAEDLYAK